MTLTDRVRNMLRSFLNIQPAPNIAFSINETLDFQANAFKNAVWFRGDGGELSQLYKQLPGKRDSFWAGVPSENHGLRKIHTGLPSIIVRVLSDIVLSDLNEPEITSAGRAGEWSEIARENGFERLLSQAVQKALYLGDGAFKVSFERELSELPILEFYGADHIGLTRRHGRTVETRFYTELDHAGRKYQLCEAYGGGYIRYTLTDRITGGAVDMRSIPQTAGLADLGFDPAVCLAVPFQIFPSAKWEGRGKSVFEEKTDSFDALDEAWSQWMDALRTGRAKEYIPATLIPRDPATGIPLTPNRFDNRFIEVQGGMSETAPPEITVAQPAIPHESYLATYITALDLCMQGLISPSTLGIDVKKLDNAEAQREKEKATLYTRGAIVSALRDTLPRVIKAALHMADLQAKNPPSEIEVSVDFGEYANPSFEAQVETVGKAATQGIMSIEAAVDELWGDAKDEAWKREEIARLKEAQGLVSAEEPFVGADAPAPVEGGEVTGSTERLNGAQVSSLLSVVRMAKEGGLSRNEAISIATSTLGVSREVAESFIEESMPVKV